MKIESLKEEIHKEIKCNGSRAAVFLSRQEFPLLHVNLGF